MKSNYIKNILVRYVLPMMITTGILLVYFYFQRGIPLVANLENRMDIISVQIIQGDDNILLSDSKNIEQAAKLVEMLSYRFGKAEGGQIDTVYVFTFKDGSKLKLGANDTTVFKNDKQYRGNADYCKLFSDCTQGIFFFSSAAGKENLIMTGTADKLGITDQNYPRIDGSTSTLPIVRAINRAMYQVSENNKFPETASKTVPSYKLLINGEVDMIIVPYASPDVLALAEDAGVKLEFFPIAAEALVFITPIENKAENITMEQVREIYLNYGITNWSTLGGTNRELIPICRNSDSGSQSQLDNLVLNGKEMHSGIQKNYVELTMEGLLEQVAFYHNGGLSGNPTDSYALGYTLYTYLKNMGEITGIDEQLKMLAFEGVIPSEESIANGSYSLTDGYYAVVRSDLPGEHSARSIINWLKSDDGKAVIKELGLIPKE